MSWLSRLDKESNRLLMLLLSADIFFIFIHLIHGLEERTPLHIYSLLAEDVFSLQYDLGIAEAYQYVKEFWVALLLCFLAVKKGKGLMTYFSWAFIFFYLLTDDMLSFHEDIGLALSHSFNLEQFEFFGSVRGRDLGELLFSAGLGSFFLMLIGISYILGDSIRRLQSTYLMIMLIILAIFGVGIDFLHMVFHQVRLLEALFLIVEDGGEMFVVSIIVWIVFQLFSQDKLEQFDFVETVQNKLFRKTS